MKYRHVVIDTSTYDGDQAARVTQLETDLNLLGEDGYRLVATAGPLFIVLHDRDA